jgi:hypothetical protein
MSEEDIEMEVLLEAFRLIKGHHMKKARWPTWNVFSGRCEYHEESDEQWTLRALRQARDNVKQKGQLKVNN